MGTRLNSETDEALVALTLSESMTRTVARRELFSRYYDRIDATIRGVLLSREMQYEPSVSYYNTVFFEVCSAVFAERTLSGFDPSRGSFCAWFLGAVVPRAAIDWHRRQNNVTPPQRELLDRDTAPYEDSHGEEARRLDEALARLSPTLRSAVEVFCCAHWNVSEETLRHIADSSGQSVSDVRDTVNSLAEMVRRDGKGREGEDIRQKLAVLHALAENFSLRLEHQRRLLNQIGIDAVALGQLEAECSQLTLSQVRAERVLIAKSSEATREALAAVLYQELFLRLNMVSARRERLLADYRQGTWLAKPSYSQIAGILGVAEGTVAARLSRAKEQLAAHLEIRL